jgi:hypothetical protein
VRCPGQQPPGIAWLSQYKGHMHSHYEAWKGYLACIFDTGFLEVK